MLTLLALVAFACPPDPVDVLPDLEPPTPVAAPTPHASYAPVDAAGRTLIDALFLVTPQAVAEMAGRDESPESYLLPFVDELNATLARSLVDTVRVRALGVHRLVEEDFERTGVWPGNTNVSMENAWSWLGTYRESYGADKVIVVTGTEEGASDAALGGGDLSAHWVDFLPFDHEFGHQMGGGHCYDGTSNAGYPIGGYTDEGEPRGAPFEGGTRMCGNSLPFFSNPDLRLTLAEIESYVAQGLMPDADWEAVLDDDGTLPLGHPEFADMAQWWRDHAEEASERMPTVLVPGDEDLVYVEPSCVGLFADAGYRDRIAEVCEGETVTIDRPVAAVALGQDVHANLYSDASGGMSSMCGGAVVRLAFSSPDLAAYRQHRGLEPIAVRSISVYDPDDRAAHARFDGPYTLLGANAAPTCDDGRTLTVMPDDHDWAATAALYDTPVSIPFAVEFDLRSAHYGDEPPADGLAFFFGQDTKTWAQAPSRERFGVPDAGGDAVLLDVWRSQVGLPGREIALQTYTAGHWLPTRIEVQEDEVRVLLGGTEVYRAPVKLDRRNTGVGFSAYTGYYTSAFEVRDVAFEAL